MMSTRGDPGPDPMVSLLGIVGDPAATADRIKQLQAAKEDSVKALEALQARAAELDKQASDQDDREELLKEWEKSLEAKTIELDGKLAAASANAKALDDREVSGQEQIAAELAKAKAQADANAEVSRNLAVREQELEANRAEISQKMAGFDARENNLTVREELVQQRLDEVDKKMAALRELVA